MFENFTSFFSNKKNINVFIIALVILLAIFFLKRSGLYEGLENQDSAQSSAPAQGSTSAQGSASAPDSSLKKESSTIAVKQIA
jgi:hypothetical protein